MTIVIRGAFHGVDETMDLSMKKCSAPCLPEAHSHASTHSETGMLSKHLNGIQLIYNISYHDLNISVSENSAS